MYLRDKFGPWLRHKVRVVIVKQWKKCVTIYKNLLSPRVLAAVYETRTYGVMRGARGAIPYIYSI